MPTNTEITGAPAWTINAQEKAVKIPPNYICPITMQIMEQPMMSRKSALNFERAAICAWMDKNGEKCPVTGDRLRPAELIPNSYLATQIKAWRDEMEIPKDATVIRPVSSSKKEEEKEKLEDDDAPKRQLRRIGERKERKPRRTGNGRIAPGRRWSRFRKAVHAAEPA